MTDSKSVFLRSEDCEIVKEQIKVAERLATYFSTAAAKIGKNHVSSLTEVDFEDHKSVKVIQEKYEDTSLASRVSRRRRRGILLKRSAPESHVDGTIDYHRNF